MAGVCRQEPLCCHGYMPSWIYHNCYYYNIMYLLSLSFPIPHSPFLPLFMINFHCYFAWIPTWQGLDGFQRYLILCSLDESSLSTGRVKGSSRYSRQDLWYFWQSHLNGESIYKEFGGVLLVMFRLTFLLQISFSDMLMPIIFRQNCQATFGRCEHLWVSYDLHGKGCSMIFWSPHPNWLILPHTGLNQGCTF